MRFIPFRFNSFLYSGVYPLFFIYDFSIKFNLYRFSDLPNFQSILTATLLPEQPSKIACSAIFSELFFYQFQLSNSVGVGRSKNQNLVYILKQLEFSSFISYLRFIFVYPDTRNLVSKPSSGSFNSFTFKIKDLSTLYNFFDFKLSYAYFYPNFHFFATSLAAHNSSEIQEYFLSFFSAYMHKTSTIFG